MFNFLRNQQSSKCSTLHSSSNVRKLLLFCESVNRYRVQFFVITWTTVAHQAPLSMGFFWIFYINQHVIYEQRQFYFFLPSLYTLMFLSCFHLLARVYSMKLKRVMRREILALHLVLVKKFNL